MNRAGWLVFAVVVLTILATWAVQRCATEQQRADRYQQMYEGIELIPAETVWYPDTVRYSQVKYYKLPADTVPKWDTVMEYCPPVALLDSAEFDKVKVWYFVEGLGYVTGVHVEAQMKGIDYINRPVIIHAPPVTIPDTRTHITASAWGWTTGQTAAGVELSFPSRWGVGVQAALTGRQYAVGLTYRLR